MRSAIFLGLTLIACTQLDYALSSSIKHALAFIFGVFLGMDIIEFIKKL